MRPARYTPRVYPDDTTERTQTYDSHLLARGTLRPPLHRDGRRHVPRHGGARDARTDGARRRRYERVRTGHLRDAARHGSRDDGPDGRVDALSRPRLAAVRRDGGRHAAADIR